MVAGVVVQEDVPDSSVEELNERRAHQWRLHNNHAPPWSHSDTPRYCAHHMLIHSSNIVQLELYLHTTWDVYFLAN